MRPKIILVGVLSLALGAALGFAQPKAEKSAGTTEAVNPNSQAPAGEPGVLVVAVQKDSPAQKAGIARGDIILTLDGTVVNTAAELIKSVEAHKSGDAVAVKLRHGDTEKTMTVTLAERNGHVWMGAALFPDGRERGREFGDNQEFGYQFPFSGAYVASVVPGSPADKAGLKQGDVILSVDGTNVDPRHNLADLIGAKKVGDTVTLSVGTSAQGQGQSPRDVKVTLDKSPAGDVPYAGIQYMPAPPRFGQGPRSGAFMGPGVLVADVAADGPAAKAGIKTGDVITKVQGTAARNPKEVADVVAAHKPGDTLSVTVHRVSDDKDVDVTVTLAANPSDATKAYMGITTSSTMELLVPGPQRPNGMHRPRMGQPDNTFPGI